MDTISTRTKRIVLGIAIIIVLGIVIAVIHQHETNTAPHNNSVQDNTPTSTAAIGIALSSTGENSVAATTPTESSSVTTSGIPTLPGPSITINLLTPIANNLWTIGQPNPIAWSAPANITGEIDLVDATTKQFIGVIISNIGANQTSYIWDARSIYLARYSADKKDVVPGTYSVRIHFDGNGLSDLISGPVTISD